ncbi:MAG: aminoacyl-tRNA hydrolase [Nitrospirae bacterium]|nr:aminoacyl-tRNA hydrolase [Nitrospirota bacterium]
MWYIIGLGNPGAKYKNTRHNAGFAVIDEIARAYGIALKVRGEVEKGEGAIDATPVTLIKPLTYMNRSGLAVYSQVRANSAQVIVAQDDIDMAPGRLKIKSGGGAGGHKGIQSIIEVSGTRDFTRIKIGVGKDSLIPVDEYVLSRFPPSEARLVGEAVLLAVEAAAFVINNGIEAAMNKFNKRPEAVKLDGPRNTEQERA